MPRIIASMDEHGLDAFRHAIVHFDRLPQSQRSVAWVLEQFRRGRVQGNNWWHFNRLLADMPLELVVPRMDDIRGIGNIQSTTAETIQQRRELADLTTDTLWQKLVDFTVKSDGQYVTDINWRYAKQLVTELALRTDFAEDLVFDVLGDQEREGDYLAVCCTMLAGQRTMHAAIPLLMDQVAINGDLICEEGAQALVRIGTETVLEQVAERLPSESDYFQLFASTIFGDVRNPKAAAYAYSLLRAVNDKVAHSKLIESLCWSLEEWYLTEAYDFILQGQYIPFFHDLRKPLYCAAKITGLDFPELGVWRRDFEEEEKRVDKLTPELEQLLGRGNEPERQSQPLATPVRRAPKIGRNEPCPCGSGKKYKKCCLK